MAPIHHHFELGGWPETTVIVRFWLLAGVVRRHRARALLRRLHQHRRARLTDHVVLGLGVTGQAVLRALRRPRRGGGGRRRRTDAGRPGPGRRARRAPWSRRPTPDELRAVVAGARRRGPEPRACPTTTRCSPPRATPACRCCRSSTSPRRWDDRPLVAITGTDGKTTVTELARSMFEADRASTPSRSGNTEVPLVAAIDDPTVDVFVVEASSFRLLHSHHFAPDVGTWLNVAPDHLDPDGSATTPRMADYIAAKARLWADQAPTRWPSATPTTRRRGGAGAGAGPPRDLRARRRRRQPARRRPARARHRRHPRRGRGAATAPSPTTSPTRWPRPRHVVHAGGAVGGRAATALLAFRGLPHRVALVGEAGGVRWFDDSKATAPHATRAARAGLRVPSC